MPNAAVKLFGYTTPQWSQLVAMMGLTGAVIALGLGPLIDRWSSSRVRLNRAGETAWLETDSDLDALREDQRFVALLRVMH